MTQNLFLIIPLTRSLRVRLFDSFIVNYFNLLYINKFFLFFFISEVLNLTSLEKLSGFVDVRCIQTMKAAISLCPHLKEISFHQKTASLTAGSPQEMRLYESLLSNNLQEVIADF